MWRFIFFFFCLCNHSFWYFLSKILPKVNWIGLSLHTATSFSSAILFVLAMFVLISQSKDAITRPIKPLDAGLLFPRAPGWTLLFPLTSSSGYFGALWKARRLDRTKRIDEMGVYWMLPLVYFAVGQLLRVRVTMSLGFETPKRYRLLGARSHPPQLFRQEVKTIRSQPRC